MPEDPVVFSHDFLDFRSKSTRLAFFGTRQTHRGTVEQASRQNHLHCFARDLVRMCLPEDVDLDSGSHPPPKHDNERPHPRLPRCLPKTNRSILVEKVQRTTVRFKNGSKIVALPNSPQLLRGYTAN